MLSINTNLSSLIAQQSMSSATNKLNQAIERMTTGYKINGAKDNAANYSISTNMTTKINSYMVAEDNVAMGLDMLSTANGSLDQISDKLTRLRALATQASNGTYGTQSLTAINSEANALVDEINRIYSTAEYNGKKLFETTLIPDVPDDIAFSADSTSYNGFIENPVTYSDSEIAAMSTFTDVYNNDSFSDEEVYSISSLDELLLFKEACDLGTDFGYDSTFVLTCDIDMSTINNWEPISLQNCINFNGNGHVIKNLKIDSTMDEQGFFSCVSDGTISNLAIVDCTINGSDAVGAIVGIMREGAGAEARVDNCYVTGTVEGNNFVGGISGKAESVDGVYNSYFIGNVISTGDYVGGISGNTYVNKCFFKGSILGENYVGGLVGSGYVINSFFEGTVTGKNYVGGLTGNGDAYDSYSKGSIVGQDYVGGLTGSGVVARDYTSAKVSGNKNVGGLSGYVAKANDIKDCQSYASVSGNENIGTFVGGLEGTYYYSYYDEEWGDSEEYTDITEFVNCNGLISSLPTVGTYYNVIEKDHCYINPDPDADDYYIYDYVYECVADEDYDISILHVGINFLVQAQTSVTLQVGINADSYSQIGLEFGFALDGIEGLRQIGLDTSTDYLSTLDNMLDVVSAKATEYGAAQNRLESALDEIAIQYDNLVSSRSTLRDADIAEVSSLYIQQQILQQASATLLATANQSPSIALQLI